MKNKIETKVKAGPPPDFLAIGHLTADILPDGSSRPGGTVAFASLLARNLGLQAAMVTASSTQMCQQITQEGVRVCGATASEATTFENIYTSQGRVQYIRELAPVIEPNTIPYEWTGKTGGVQIVHLGPVAQEFEGPDIVRLFPKALIGITPQGWLRAWDSEGSHLGRVRPIIWQPRIARKVLRKAHVLVLSTEDLPAGEVGQDLLKEYINYVPIVILTQGPKGCQVFRGEKVDYVPACPANEVDPTGAGDIFAAAFFIKLNETKEPLLSARFAHAAAACHIEKPGLEGIPTRYEILQRLASLPD